MNLSSVTSIGNNNSFTTAMSELWFLSNPATGANTVSVTFGNGVRAVGFGASFLGVSSTSGLGAPSATTGSTSVATLSGIAANGTDDYLAAIIAMADGANGISLSGPNLSIWTTQGNASAFAVGGVDTQRAPDLVSSLTVKSTVAVAWSMAGVAILAAGGAAGGPVGGGAYFFRRRHR